MIMLDIFDMNIVGFGYKHHVESMSLIDCCTVQLNTVTPLMYQETICV